MSNPGTVGGTTTLTKRPFLLSDLLIKKDQSLYAQISGITDDPLAMGTPLKTSDGGVSFTAAGSASPDGILLEHVSTNGKAEVLITGEVRAKHVVGFNEPMRQRLFPKKIIAR